MFLCVSILRLFFNFVVFLKFRISYFNSKRLFILGVTLVLSFLLFSPLCVYALSCYSQIQINIAYTSVCSSDVPYGGYVPSGCYVDNETYSVCVTTADICCPSPVDDTLSVGMSLPTSVIGTSIQDIQNQINDNLPTTPSGALICPDGYQDSGGYIQGYAYQTFMTSPGHYEATGDYVERKECVKAGAEICGNGIDDNGDGNVDESPCITPPSGGSTGGGTGGGGSGSGGTAYFGCVDADRDGYDDNTGDVCLSVLNDSLGLIDTDMQAGITQLNDSINQSAMDIEDTISGIDDSAWSQYERLSGDTSGLGGVVDDRDGQYTGYDATDLPDETSSEYDLTGAIRGVLASSPVASLFSDSAITTSSPTCTYTLTYNGSPFDLDFCPYTSIFDFIGTVSVMLMSLFMIYLVFM